jgi:hypothetical protein
VLTNITLIEEELSKLESFCLLVKKLSYKRDFLEACSSTLETIDAYVQQQYPYKKYIKLLEKYSTEYMKNEAEKQLYMKYKMRFERLSEAYERLERSIENNQRIVTSFDIQKVEKPKALFEIPREIYAEFKRMRVNRTKNIQVNIDKYLKHVMSYVSNDRIRKNFFTLPLNIVKNNDFLVNMREMMNNVNSFCRDMKIDNYFNYVNQLDEQGFKDLNGIFSKINVEFDDLNFIERLKSERVIAVMGNI